MRLTVVATTLALALILGTDAQAGSVSCKRTEDVYINVNGLG